jgi:hypothetical protein
MAYNDISFISGLLFFALVPIIFLLPSKAMIQALVKEKTKK